MEMKLNEHISTGGKSSVSTWSGVRMSTSSYDVIYKTDMGFTYQLNLFFDKFTHMCAPFSHSCLLILFCDPVSFY